MKLIGLLFVYVFLFVLQSHGVVGLSEGNSNKKEVTELKIRGGLPNFFDKIQKGDSTRVAYLGGSITAQSGWRVYSLEWMQKQFPKAKFSEINAAIGGTGSTFGVFRLNEHVLKYQPDLVFVEFAVNDDGRSSKEIIRAMEGIVRQTWTADAHTDICFVYTLKENFLETEQAGILPLSAQEMEKVADKYDIPTINFGFEVAKMVSESSLIFTGKEKEIDGTKVFSPDGVHPYVETGHRVYQEVLARSFLKMKLESRKHSVSHTVGKPIAPDYFSNTQMLDFTLGNLSEGWKILNIDDDPEFSKFNRYLNKVGKADQTGESLAVHFNGKSIGFYDIKGPDAGRVVVELDGMVKDTVSRFDSYCTYRRMSYYLIDHLEKKDHVIVFKALSDPFNKAAILNKDDIVKNPEKYSENNWYLGKILVDGEIITDK